MRFRGKSIRRKIVALLLVPLVALTAIWAFAVFLTGRDALQLMRTGSVVEDVGYPLVDSVQEIQEERALTLRYLADPGASDVLAALRQQRLSTDSVLAHVRDNAEHSEGSSDLSNSASNQLRTILDGFAGLGALRQNAGDHSVTRREAYDQYNRLVDPVLNFLLALPTLNNSELDKQARALIGISRARETLSREDALFGSALVARRMDARDLRDIADLVTSRTVYYTVSLPALPRHDRDAFTAYWQGPRTVSLRSAESNALAAGPAGAADSVPAQRWKEAASTALGDLDRMGTEAREAFKDRVKPAAVIVIVKLAVAAALGIVGLLVSLIVSVRIGRELVRDLRRLRKEAHEVSGVRLPSVMRRLASGELVDVETEAPRLEYGKYEKDEVGQVGQALNTLQRAAVEAAVRQADMRRGVSEVFVNLARRNQVLLHRQLTLLDTMERRTEDTEELADLFRLDHLTTRMRRHAEGLVILSGASPSRQWRKPVQLMDVVRAAVAEVEDYERIEVRRLPRIGVGGPAVADLTHLIAELLENATVFSPPHTAVQVHGERVANGFTLEIHDRGLGMTAEALLDANLRLAETPEFELSDTDRLGLFVVSRLAQRQNVRVSLQQSPYGGTTAVVFIPVALLTDASDIDTNGVGFRLDRKSSGPAGEPRVRAALTPVPPGLEDLPPLIDGPVELEPPVETLAYGKMAFGDEDSEPGGIFRGREQHQQTPDQVPRASESARPDATVPLLPRRRKPQPPTLVSDHGRRVDVPAPRAAEPASKLLVKPAPKPAAAPDGLPRRVRQANLAPQLRDASASEQPAAAADDIERDADEVRSRMASLQRGWQRGREQNGEHITGSPAETAPGTTSEGSGR
ncbi:sensor histidine kinase [Streptomyces beijiangensis]|uniref:histidine kinase n=1 Tax=Streptomyces beijiangensis TaxID=163361 RepID=A0A939FBH8_9ACTN|nr:nitrate- and nitrite sensing domain-containing protein [Streptomyces beijiangensis]MBO0515201.1 sensor histidine kinase [Streptomyces beijiangensis]